MPTRPLLLFALTLVTPLAWAQDPARRVEREASNPMRMIIEAAKIRPKAKIAEAAKPVPRTSAELAPAAAEARVPPVVEAPAAAAAEAPAAAAAEAPAAAAAEAPAAPVPSVAEAEPAPLPPAGPPESTVATVEVAATPRISVPEVTPPVAEPEPVALKLASVVEPVMPRQWLGKLRGELQVHIAFTVNADGTVAGATVRRSSHPQLDASVLEAVRQWRYEPIAAPRPHEVQLVLRQPD
jgi:TonB family protein